MGKCLNFSEKYDCRHTRAVQSGTAGHGLLVRRLQQTSLHLSEAPSIAAVAPPHYYHGFHKDLFHLRANFFFLDIFEVQINFFFCRYCGALGGYIIPVVI